MGIAEGIAGDGQVMDRVARRFGVGALLRALEAAPWVVAVAIASGRGRPGFGEPAELVGSWATSMETASPHMGSAEVITGSPCRTGSRPKF